jgi:hypothetical protein
MMKQTVQILGIRLVRQKKVLTPALVDALEKADVLSLDEKHFHGPMDISSDQLTFLDPHSSYSIDLH